MMYYLIIINIIGFMMCYIDKKKAINHKYRISEYSLISISIIGGCYGFILGMYMFHHKTKKIKFRICIPIICIIWLYIIWEVLL